MGVLVYPFDRRDPLGGWQQSLGRGGREGERLEQSGACKRGDVLHA